MENIIECLRQFYYVKCRRHVTKGLISNTWLVIQYTVQLVMYDNCTKFQTSRSRGYRKIFDQNFHNNYIGERKKNGTRNITNT